MAQVSGIMELTAPLRMNVRRTNLTEEQFIELCQENPELRLELTAHGELVIMPPTGSESGWRSGQVFLSLGTWAKQDGTGLSFDSSTGFRFPTVVIRLRVPTGFRHGRWIASSKVQRRRLS